MGLLLTVTSSGSAMAQDEGYGATFARVRQVEGALKLQRTQEGEVVEADVNTPVASGDRAWTEGGRAEIGLADGSIIWLDQDTRLDLRNLADLDNRYEKTNLLALDHGSLRIQAAGTEEKDKVFQIDTEAGSVYLLSEGVFRIDVEGGVTTVSSFRGVAEASGDDGSRLVRSGERTSVRQGRVPADARPFNTMRLDDFDRYCETRSEAYLRQGAGETEGRVEKDVPEEVRPYVGELSVYGGWHNVDPYGWVWRPTYYGDWGPYVSGRWAWYPTGWVWVSYDPWGWAPYHYGRWDFAVDLGWVWIPGGIWSGAWVSFAVGPSYIGWCPLGFYNRPVFYDTRFIGGVDVNVGRLGNRGWRFVPNDHFGDRKWSRGTLLTPDRLPRGTDVVVTRQLPKFEPRGIAARPAEGRKFVETVRASRTPLPAEGAPGRSVPFRSLERTAPRPVPSANRVETRSMGRPRLETRGPNPQPSSPRALPRRESPMSPRDERVRERAQRPVPERSAIPRAVPQPRGYRPGEPGSGSPRPEVRQPERRREHAIESIVDGVRRERVQPRVAPPPPRVAPGPSRPVNRPPARPPQAQPRGGNERPPRPPKERVH
ncbi:MAG TPA: DUF6600 domain-containing protein [Candidatus Polarisedimenticolia bacterium]|nr:DUF6600 domain-containing protein [Candidatus Polarisedimenticolia bacterium]